MRSGADTYEQEACVIAQDQLMTILDMYKRWTGKHKGLNKGQFVGCLCTQKKTHTQKKIRLYRSLAFPKRRAFLKKH